MTKNKNVDTAIRAAEQLGRADFPLVVVGGDNSKVFGGGATESRAGVVIAGRLKDEEIAALFARAAAFVFPSLYEGFGVPPLEAMYFACPVIASSADAVRETCDDAAVYFDPLNAGELSARMRERIELGRISPAEQEKQRQRLMTYSWAKSAAAMLEFLAKPASAIHIRPCETMTRPNYCCLARLDVRLQDPASPYLAPSRQGRNDRCPAA